MERKHKIYADFQEKMNTRIIEATPVYGGVNSNVYKIIDQYKNKFALKQYPKPNNEDQRDRRLQEKTFYDYLRINNINSSPLLVHTSKELCYSVFTWIEGVK